MRNFIIGLLVVLISQVCCLNANAQSPKPSFTYLNDLSLIDTSKVKLTGTARSIEFNGRKGLNITTIHGALQLKQHTMNKTRGTVTLWVMPLEDLSAYDVKDGMKKSNPHYYTYPFLSDNPNPQDYESANFKLAWTPRWHPSITAQFGKGNFYEEAFNLPHKAIISVSHFAFKAKKWYQLSLSWDYEKDQYRLFVNGVAIGKEDQYHLKKLYRDVIRPSLYIGNPALCYSEINFYDEVLSPAQVYTQFRKEVGHFNQQLEDELLYTYAGKGTKPFNWKPGINWQQKLGLTLTKPSDLDSLHVQGNPVDVRITKTGLLVETVNKEYTHALLDSQVYVWSNRPFEGDLYVEYEFKALRPAGLSLLMVQASGMNREDFMSDHPLRTSGKMTTVYGEDVRNYHWEYYREMGDMRNDLENSALMKNPFLYPLCFRSLNKPLEINKWHKLQFRQIGNKLTGAIDGVVMVEFTDNGFDNNGPVYDFGRIAIRCMLRTKMLFRNLKVYNKATFKSEKIANVSNN